MYIKKTFSTDMPIGQSTSNVSSVQFQNVFYVKSWKHFLYQQQIFNIEFPPSGKLFIYIRSNNGSEITCKNAFPRRSLPI